MTCTKLRTMSSLPKLICNVMSFCCNFLLQKLSSHTPTSVGNVTQIQVCSIVPQIFDVGYTLHCSSHIGHQVCSLHTRARQQSVPSGACTSLKERWHFYTTLLSGRFSLAKMIPKQFSQSYFLWMSSLLLRPELSCVGSSIVTTSVFAAFTKAIAIQTNRSKGLTKYTQIPACISVSNLYQ